eukprot:augustus_masked-scaffold_15-processed-gene-1.43-mRNA-1 protein AED:0.21 eAED:0.22 QI:0/-1/0/1/-1/1/1/0/661
MSCCCSLKTLSGFVVNSFFYSVEVLNAENAPLEGPVLFVGNHNNQFIDAAMMLYVVPRKVSFIIAEKSMHRFIIGDLARMASAVPVVRPQDEAVAGKGVISELSIEKNILTGKETNFSKEDKLKKGSKIDVKNIGEFKVVEVISDTELTFKLEGESEEKNSETLSNLQTVLQESGKGISYKIFPAVDQAKMYDEVFTRLGSGGSIAIFPEGGSHDRPQLLPLKAGVAAMALGAQANGVNDIKIVPVGINYFEASSFRSRVLVEVGKPIPITEDIYQKYVEGNRRQAYSDVLEEVKLGLENVTLNAADYKTQEILRTLRRLYQNGSELSADRYLELSRRFLRGYEVWKKDEEYCQLLEKTDKYLSTAKSLGLTDKDIEDLPPRASFLVYLKTIGQILWSFVIILILCTVQLPGLILSSPYLILLNRKVNREVKKALAKSKVKINASDVAASYKVITTAAYLPTAMFLETVVALLLCFFLYNNAATSVASVAPEGFFLENIFWIGALLLFFILFPVYFMIGVLVLESAIWRAKVLPRRMFTLFQITKRFFSKCWCCGGTALSPETDVRVQRRNLVLQVQNVVLRLTADDEVWIKDPILDQKEIMSRREVTSKELASLIGIKGKDIELIRHKSLDDPTLARSLDQLLGTSQKAEIAASPESASI